LNGRFQTFTIYDDYNRVGGVKRNKLRALPITPKIMHGMKTTFPICSAISNNTYSMQMKENDCPIYFMERKAYTDINQRNMSAILIHELGNGIENIDRSSEPYTASSTYITVFPFIQ